MTAKEKAKELVSNYFCLITNLPFKETWIEIHSKDYEKSKECALLMVQEMINTGSLEPQLKRHKMQKVPAKIFEVEYWFEVKKEINEL